MIDDVGGCSRRHGGHVTAARAHKCQLLLDFRNDRQINFTFECVFDRLPVLWIQKVFVSWDFNAGEGTARKCRRASPPASPPNLSREVLCIDEKDIRVIHMGISYTMRRGARNGDDAAFGITFVPPIQLRSSAGRQPMKMPLNADVHHCCRRPL